MKKPKKMSPAEVVIEELGVRPLARELGVSPGCIVRWRTRGGKVPHQYHVRICEIANGSVTPDDLVFGR